MNFIITTTELASALVIAEIFRIDPNALIAHRQGNMTVMRVRTRRMTVFTLDAIPGVAHAVNADALLLSLV